VLARLFCREPTYLLSGYGPTHIVVQIRSRLASEVESGAFYEAQQTYKSTFNRYKSKGDFQNAFSILQVRTVRRTLQLRSICCLPAFPAPPTQ
jgi:hypothetical protein